MAKQNDNEGCFLPIIICIVTLLIINYCKGQKQASDNEIDSDSIEYYTPQPVLPEKSFSKEPNTPDPCQCPKCGYRYDYFNVRRMFLRDHGMCHNCYRREHPRSSSENQYGEGFEQGYEDAQNGRDYDDSGGNGQYQKGYEDGYEEGC